MIATIDLSCIHDNPFQPRRSYDGILELALKIRELKDELPDTLGLIHPPHARLVELAADGHTIERSLPPTYPPQGVDRWAIQLAEGHRRLRAFQLLAQGDDQQGLAADPDYLLMPIALARISDQAMDDIAWDENYERKDLTPVEEAHALQRTMRIFDLTQVEVARRRKLGRSTVANKLRLLKLPADILNAIHDGRLSERHGMAYLPILDINPEDLRRTKLTDDISFQAWHTPSPKALYIRLAKKADLTADEVRAAVERTKAAVERAKKQRWEKMNAAKASPAAPAAKPAVSVASHTRSAPEMTPQPAQPQRLEMPPKSELAPDLPDVVVTIRISQSDNGSAYQPGAFTLSISDGTGMPKFYKGAYRDIGETFLDAVHLFFSPPQQETLMEMEITQ